MAQRMGALSDWEKLEGDSSDARYFPGDERLVCIEINAPSEVALWAILEDAEGKADPSYEYFIALVKGRDRVEFTVPGGFQLFATGGEVWYKTVDGLVVVNVEVAPVIFTRIANRRVRNHNLEMIEFKMNQNLEARMAELTAEAERRLQDTEARYAASRRPLLAAARQAVEESSSEGSEGQREQSSKAADGESGKDEGKGGAGGKPAKGGKTAAAASDD